MGYKNLQSRNINQSLKKADTGKINLRKQELKKQINSTQPQKTNQEIKQETLFGSTPFE